MNSTILTIIFAILLIPGLIGVILPGIPGVPYMMIVTLAFGLIDHFTRLHGIEFAVLAGITTITLVIDYFSGVLSAKFVGASNHSIVVGSIALFIGSVAFPPLGGVIALVLIVFLIELRRKHRAQHALKVATGTAIGFVAGTIINFLLAILFFVLFLIFSFN